MVISNFSSKPRVLMVAPPYRLSPGNFPLGFMYIAASMERAAFHVDVIDMDVFNVPEKD